MPFFERATDAPPKTPYLPSVLPQGALVEIGRGVLPVIEAPSLELNDGEKCHYVERAIYEQKLKVPRLRKEARPRGRLARKDTGKRETHSSVMDIAFEQHKGHLYVTSRRIIFLGMDESGWERSTAQLHVVRPYLNCVKLQFGTECLKVFVPDGSVAMQVILLVKGMS